MSVLRHLILAVSIFLMAAFGAGAVFALPLDWARIGHSASVQQITDQSPNLAFTARAPPLNGDNVAITGASFAGAGNVRVLYEVASLGDVSEFSWSSIAPNTAGTGRYTPSQPLDGAGNPIVRTNDRGGALVQPNGSVTCGQHACDMVLNTQGRPVVVDDIISSWCRFLGRHARAFV
jgi:hypothetical protein